MDVPGVFTESLMLTLRSLVHASLGKELCVEKTFSYGVFSFALPDFGEFGRKPL